MKTDLRLPSLSEILYWVVVQSVDVGLGGEYRSFRYRLSRRSGRKGVDGLETHTGVEELGGLSWICPLIHWGGVGCRESTSPEPPPVRSHSGARV